MASALAVLARVQLAQGYVAAACASVARALALRLSSGNVVPLAGSWDVRMASARIAAASGSGIEAAVADLTSLLEWKLKPIMLPFL